MGNHRISQVAFLMSWKKQDNYLRRYAAREFPEVVRPRELLAKAGAISCRTDLISLCSFWFPPGFKYAVISTSAVTVSRNLFLVPNTEARKEF